MRIKCNNLKMCRNNLIKSKKLLFLLFIFLIPTLLSIFLCNNLKYSELNLERKKDIIPDIKKLKTSKISVPIYINDDNPSNNWTVAKNAGICTGSGNYSDPYIIEDFIIDGNNLSSCIEIWNSDAYFIIRNCTVSNSAKEDFFKEAGIKIAQASNGTLMDNICTNNNGYGIYLSWCYNITVIGNEVSYNKENGMEIYAFENNITNNYVNNNEKYGMYLYGANNSVSENTVNDNNWNGIDLSSAEYNNITKNNINNNEVGIAIFGSDNNNISVNTIKFNDFGGLLVYASNNNRISENDITDNSQKGIEIREYSNNTIISKNQIDNNGWAGITVEKNTNLTISENTFDNNYIYTASSNNTKILDNTIKDCDWAGIYIQEYCYSNTLSGNWFEGCGLIVEGSLEALVSHNIDTSNYVNSKFLYYVTNKQGLFQYYFDWSGQIILINSTDSIIANSEISFGTTGVTLQYCKRIQILNMNCSYNKRSGINLKYSEDNIISGNIITMNEEDGITISDSTHNNVLENNITKNSNGLRLYQSNNNTITTNNISKNNYYGIRTEYSHYNTISNNTINHNNNDGILLYGSNYNLILGNDLRYNTQPYYEVNCVGNIFRDNILEDPTNGNGGSPAIPIENSIIITVMLITFIAIAGILIWKKKLILT